jgi:hypothetical protein
MSWIAFLLGLILAVAGGAALAFSVDLLTTELGLVYATCGAVGLSGGFITIAIGLLIRRVDALRYGLPSVAIAPVSERADPIVPPLAAVVEPVLAPEPASSVEAEIPVLSPANPPEPAASPDRTEEDEAPINENRRGHLPSLETPEPPAPEVAAPPTLVGRYGAGGANYSIFSDGSIEAETEQGAFKFASMSDFKAYIAAKRT